MYNDVEFKDLPYNDRMKPKDNLSRAAFDQYAKFMHFKYKGIGVDGSEKVTSLEIPALLRNMPDVEIWTESDSKNHLVEIKGCGNKGVKIREDKLGIYCEYNKMFDVFIFIYNASSSRYAFMPLNKLVDIASKIGTSYDKSMGIIYNIPVGNISWADAPVIHLPQYADNYTNN